MTTLAKYVAFLTLFFFCARQSAAQTADCLFLIATDGLRWQEIFEGIDSSIVLNKEYTRRADEVFQRFGAATPLDRRAKLLPFIWGEFKDKGQLIGNRKLGSEVNLRNMHGFSYPGYNEMLSGNPDPEINSNDKVYNPHTTFLEVMNNLPEYHGKVAAFGTWDVFPYIINSPRSGVPVNAGAMPASQPNKQEALLNEIQTLLPSHDSHRQDFLTYFLAKEYIKKNKPKVVLISFDETDEFAHQGNYNAYLESVHAFDAFVGDLWAFCQQDSIYAGKTTFLLTTDHGRGDVVKSQWTSHGRIIRDCFQLWMGAIGPRIPAQGELKNTDRVYLEQIASSALYLLGQESQGKVVPSWRR